jgi:hypothetical protein
MNTDSDPPPIDEATTPVDGAAALEERDRRLAEQDAIIADLRGARRLDEQLLGAGVTDLEAARLLAVSALGDMDEPDEAVVVEALVRDRPYLFRAPAPISNGAQGSRIPPPRPADALVDAGVRANESGRRQDLLTYLRLRRRR